MGQEGELLQFVGGPFDGFSQAFFFSLDELPQAVAIPLDEVAGKLFGLSGVAAGSQKIAIYEMDRHAHGVRYQFRGERLRSQFRPCASIGDAPRRLTPLPTKSGW